MDTNTSSTDDLETKNEWYLEKRTELRIEIDWNSSIEVELVRGTAEIFGTELVSRRTYTFSEGLNLAIFTWHSCVLSVKGKPKVAYKAKQTSAVNFSLNLHLALQSKRKLALESLDFGPRCVIVGQRDSGKTALCRTLISYCLKSNFQPMYINLNPDDGAIVAPTCIGAVAADQMNVEYSTGMPLLTTAPILYYYGHNSQSANPKAFLRIVGKLAKVTEERCEVDEKLRCSGYIIDTGSWDSQTSMTYLADIIDQFMVDSVIVLGHERLFNEIQSKLSETHPAIDLIKCPKSEGAVERDQAYRKQWQMKRIKEYFYGQPGSLDLSPYTTSISFNDVQVRRIGEVMLTPDSALPIGGERKVDSTQLLKLEPGPVLLNSVLALSNAELPFGATENDEAILPEFNVAGFLYCKEVDEKRKRLVFLSPKPGRLPRRYLWMGTLRWAEV